MPSGATVPPAASTLTPTQSPAGPTRPGLGLGPGGSPAPVPLCCPFQGLPRLSASHRSSLKNRGAATCPRQCPYQLVSCPQPAWSFRTFYV
jgi:hypothetical protein